MLRCQHACAAGKSWLHYFAAALLLRLRLELAGHGTMSAMHV